MLERARLLPLPEHAFETDRLRAVTSGKTPYVRFDRNLYSIPHTLVGVPLTLVAGPESVRLFHGAEAVACHTRSYDAGCIAEDRDRRLVDGPPPPRFLNAGRSVLA